MRMAQTLTCSVSASVDASRRVKTCSSGQVLLQPRALLPALQEETSDRQLHTTCGPISWCWCGASPTWRRRTRCCRAAQPLQQRGGHRERADSAEGGRPTSSWEQGGADRDALRCAVIPRLGIATHRNASPGITAHRESQRNASPVKARNHSASAMHDCCWGDRQTGRQPPVRTPGR